MSVLRLATMVRGSRQGECPASAAVAPARPTSQRRRRGARQDRTVDATLGKEPVGVRLRRANLLDVHLLTPNLRRAARPRCRRTSSAQSACAPQVTDPTDTCKRDGVGVASMHHRERHEEQPGKVLRRGAYRFEVHVAGLELLQPRRRQARRTRPGRQDGERRRRRAAVPGRAECSSKRAPA